MSQLQLEDVLIRSIRVVPCGSLHAPKKRERAKLDVNVTYTIAEMAGVPTRFRGSLSITLKPEQVPTSPSGPIPDMEMSVDGLFRVLGEVPEEMARLFKEQSAPAILYGVCRGIALMITGVMPTGRVNWPTLNMTSLTIHRPPESAEANPERGLRPSKKVISAKKRRAKTQE